MPLEVDAELGSDRRLAFVVAEIEVSSGQIERYRVIIRMGLRPVTQDLQRGLGQVGTLERCPKRPVQHRARLERKLLFD